jgi:hypothetical protein
MNILVEDIGSGVLTPARGFIRGQQRTPQNGCVPALRSLASLFRSLAEEAEGAADGLEAETSHGTRRVETVRKPLIYVSGPSRELERCERAMQLCRELGAGITHDWTVEVRQNGMGTPPTHEAQLQAALLDLEGVARCDAMLFLDGPHASPGRWVEFGAAWMAGKPLVAVIPPGCPEYLWHRLAPSAASDEAGCAAAVALARTRILIGVRHA